MNWIWAIRLCLPASVDTDSHVDVHSGYLPHQSEEKKRTAVLVAVTILLAKASIYVK